MTDLIERAARALAAPAKRGQTSDPLSVPGRAPHPPPRQGEHHEHPSPYPHRDRLRRSSRPARRPDMAGETQVTVIGNLTSDPELRFTPNGAAVANFRIASTPRVFDRQANEWRDGKALFLSCLVWRQYAENVAGTLRKGMQVIVQGRLKSRSYETDAGEKRTVFEIDVEDVGPTLRYATATVNRTTKGGSGGQSSNNAWSASSKPSTAGNDPWNSGPSKQPANDPWAQQTNSEPPF